MEIKAAILGLGNIANKMAHTLNSVEGVSLYAVGSRDKAKAEEFAKKYGAQKAYGSYEELAADQEVSLVYIATPHAFHAENALLCLENGKNVLVEKPFAVNAGQAAEVFAKAKEKGLFAGEAIWTRYAPIQRKLKELLDSGVIGEVTCVTACTGGQLTEVKRLTEPELAGGALLDVGIYPLNFASMVIQQPITEIRSNAVLTEKGVDAQNGFILNYSDGKMAILGSSILSEMNSLGVIYGTKGRIEADFILDIRKLTVITSDATQIIESPAEITGFEYEVQSALKAIGEGRIEPEEMPHSETVKMLRVMDSLRRNWGVVYPFVDELTM